MYILCNKSFINYKQQYFVYQTLLLNNLPQTGISLLTFVLLYAGIASQTDRRMQERSVHITRSSTSQESLAVFFSPRYVYVFYMSTQSHHSSLLQLRLTPSLCEIRTDFLTAALQTNIEGPSCTFIQRGRIIYRMFHEE